MEDKKAQGLCVRTYERIINMKEHKPKPLSYYSKKIQEYKELPHFLSELLLEMSTDYGMVTQKKIESEIKKAQFWMKHKDLGSEKPVSDKMLEAMYLLVDGGESNRIKLYLKALEKLMSCIRSHLRVLEAESRNQL